MATHPDGSTVIGIHALIGMNRSYRAITGREAYLTREERDGSYWYLFADGVAKRGYETALAHMIKVLDDVRTRRVPSL